VARALGYSLAARLLAATFERLPAGNFSVVLVLQCGRLDELYMRPVQRGNVSNGGRLLLKSVFWHRTLQKMVIRWQAFRAHIAPQQTWTENERKRYSGFDRPVLIDPAKRPEREREPMW